MSQQFTMVERMTSTGMSTALKLHEIREIGGEQYEWSDVDFGATGIADDEARQRLLVASQNAFERTERGLA